MSHLTDKAREPYRAARCASTLDDPARRLVLKGAVGASLAAIFGPTALLGCASGSSGGTDYRVSFAGVAKTTADTVTVPAGYRAEVLFCAGDPVVPGATGYSGTLLTSAQGELVAGGNHDGMHYFAMPGVDPQDAGLLAVNFELPDYAILFPTGNYNAANATPEQKRAALSAVGVAVIEVQRNAATGAWSVNRNSAYNKRYSGNTVFNVTGPAAALVGPTVVGTLNNCANGSTPWGTYLTCEESTDNYLDPTQAENGYGWVIEIDPLNALAGAPAKRTAMGRFDHENVAYMTNGANRVAFYMGDDKTPGCIYKFIPSRAFDASHRQANATLLDEGTLYVARFNDDGSGEWRALAAGTNGLPASQAEILVDTHQSAQTAGATLMDRPEWITVAPDNTIYVSLTNNSGRTATNAANPRAGNRHGHIIRWNETDNSPLATTFRWEMFLLAGDASIGTPTLNGTIVGDTFSSPDGLRVDPQGRLWAQTDMSVPGSSGASGRSNVDVFGNNAMYHLDRDTRRSTRFLVGPTGCEITGIAYTPDLTTMFINIQHPTGAWPAAGMPARSSTIVVRRDDGKPIGA